MKKLALWKAFFVLSISISGRMYGMEKAPSHNESITLVTADKREFKATTALLYVSPQLLSETRLAINGTVHLTNVHSTVFEPFFACLNALIPLKKNIGGTYIFKDAYQALVNILHEADTQKLIELLAVADRFDAHLLIKIFASIIAYRIKAQAPTVLKNVRSYCEGRNWHISERCCEVLKRYLLLIMLGRQELSVGDYCAGLTYPLTFTSSVTMRQKDISDLDGVHYLPQPEQIKALDISFNTILLCSVFDIPHHLSLFQAFSCLTSLNLSNNQLKALPSSLLRGLINLRILNLGKNQLKNASTDALKSLVKLQKLYLDYNALEEIDNDALVNLTELQELDLQHNQLTRFKCILPFSLKSLNLDCNRLKNFPSDFFERALSLRILKLAGNQLEQNSTGSFLRVYRIPSSVVVNYGSQDGPHTINLGCKTS